MGARRGMRFFAAYRSSWLLAGNIALLKSIKDTVPSLLVSHVYTRFDAEEVEIYSFADCAKT